MVMSLEMLNYFRGQQGLPPLEPMPRMISEDCMNGEHCSCVGDGYDCCDCGFEEENIKEK
jgi:hypothetical protein